MIRNINVFLGNFMWMTNTKRHTIVKVEKNVHDFFITIPTHSLSMFMEQHQKLYESWDWCEYDIRWKQMTMMIVTCRQEEIRANGVVHCLPPCLPACSRSLFSFSLYLACPLVPAPPFFFLSTGNHHLAVIKAMSTKGARAAVQGGAPLQLRPGS